MIWINIGVISMIKKKIGIYSRKNKKESFSYEYKIGNQMCIFKITKRI